MPETHPDDRPSGDVKITRTVSYEYREPDDGDPGWYVQPRRGAAFERFAHPQAKPRDVEQLIRKEYDPRY